MSQLYLNVTVKPLDDIRVRQAIAHAIDRKGIVQFKGPGTSREAVSVVPANYLGTDAKAPTPLAGSIWNDEVKLGMPPVWWR